RCRARDPRGRSAGADHDRPAPERAALREAAGHHESEEETPRDADAERARRRSEATVETGEIRASGPAPERDQSEGCSGAGGCVEEEGVDLMAAKVLIVAEHDGARLNPSTAKAVTCARGIPGAEIAVGVFAAKADAVAAQAAQLSGVARVLTIENPA